MANAPDRVVERVTTKVDLNEFGCHVSRYSVGSHGYAQVGWYTAGVRTMTLCHRVVWVASYGPIPDGMTVDHLCKNRKCVNVGHLRLLSNYENARRTFGRDWPVGGCVNGHGPDDSYVQVSGRRLCRPCNDLSQARYKQKSRPGKRATPTDT